MLRLFFLFLAAPALAGEARVIDARATETGAGWRFDVTVEHGDTGWDHYADGWAVLDADGNELGYRTLHHPHVDEMPFTRSLSGVDVPEGTEMVFIRADDSVHGEGTTLFPVSLGGS
ncbi:MAG: hypothetical protein AAGI50_20205 [Pseudomonadota bacterium]